MVYKWKEGFRASVDVNTAAEVFEGLEKQNKLTAANVVEVSKEETAPLHRCFEWNNDNAAQKWREQQARVLIDNVVTVITTEQSQVEPIIIRAYHNERDSGRYNSIPTILSSADLQNAVLEEAKEDAKRFIKKYKNLQAVMAITEEMKKFLEAM